VSRETLIDFNRLLGIIKTPISHFRISSSMRDVYHACVTRAPTDEANR